jgi:hypothetical protein
VIHGPAAVADPVFWRRGPAFRRGVELPEADNVDVYNVICAALDITLAPNDGGKRFVRQVLRA